MLLEGRSIAVIEDDPIMGESLLQALSLEGADVAWWRDDREARQGLAARRQDVVICDIRLPGASGAELFLEISGRGSMLPPFLFMTAYGQLDEAVVLLRAGAYDYITKPFEIDNLLERVKALLPARSTPRSSGEGQYPSLGCSPAMRHVEDLLTRVAELPSSVLLGGPTGSGKEVAAAFLHKVSTRGSEPFVAVNCAALPSDLIESELFGHERGAFTGANSVHRGFAERAKRGILFLDEIGELPMRLQPKLLRLIEQRTFTRVGGERLIQFEARIVCASNRDLGEAASAGEFRADLYHRINTIEVTIPPLKERRDDIEGLLRHFFDGFSRQRECSVRGYASTTIDVALEHDWPGNVRELRNRVERAVALAPGEWIMPHDLFPDRSNVDRADSSGGFTTLAVARASAERRARRQILRGLKQTHGNLSEAAMLLGVSRTTLWEKMRRLDIAAPSQAE